MLTNSVHMQERSDSYSEYGHWTTAPSRFHPSLATLRSRQLHGNISPIYVHQSKHCGDLVPRVRTSRTSDRRRQVVCVELEDGVPNPCGFHPPDIQSSPRVTYTFVFRLLEPEKYILRNPNPLQQHLAGDRVRFPTHRRSLPRQLRSPSHRHIYHSGPNNQIRTLRPLVRGSRSLCRVTLGRIGVLRAPFFLAWRPTTSFLALLVGSHRYGSNPNVRHHDGRACCVLRHIAPLRIVGAREARRDHRSVGGLGSLHFRMGEEGTHPTHF